MPNQDSSSEPSTTMPDWEPERIPCPDCDGKGMRWTVCRSWSCSHGNDPYCASEGYECESCDEKGTIANPDWFEPDGWVIRDGEGRWMWSYAGAKWRVEQDAARLAANPDWDDVGPFRVVPYLDEDKPK